MRDRGYSGPQATLKRYMIFIDISLQIIMDFLQSVESVHFFRESPKAVNIFHDYIVFFICHIKCIQEFFLFPELPSKICTRRREMLACSSQETKVQIP